jgi:hypothetical protein
MDDTPYEKKKQEELGDLTDFLEDVQWRRGVEAPFNPYFKETGKKKQTLHSFLEDLVEADEDELDGDEPEDDIDVDSEPEDAEPEDVEGETDVDVDDDEVDVDSDEEPEIDVDDSDEEPELDDMGYEDPDAEEEPEVDDGSPKLFLGPGQRYFMGAGSEPSLSILTKVDDDKIYYYQHPWKKEQMIDKKAGIELLTTGSKTWMENDSGADEDLTKSIQAILNGKPGEKVALDDYQFVNVQIRYNGPEKGDHTPWKELEQEYDVNVSSVLNNKQTYNLRMTNRKLDQLQDQIREKEPSDRNFRITKIVKEERNFLLEAFAYEYSYRKPKPIRKEIGEHEVTYLKSLIAEKFETGETCCDYQVGQIVIWKKDLWTIGDFINLGPWNPDKTAEKDIKDQSALLYCWDRNEVAEYVPLTQLQAADSEDIIGMGKDAIAKTPVAKELKFPVTDPTTGENPEQKSLDKNERKMLKEDLSGTSVKLYKFITEKSEEMFEQYLSRKSLNHLIKRVKFKKPDSYDEERALDYFRKVADRGASKMTKNVLPERVLEEVAIQLKVDFEKNIRNDNFQEAKNLVESLSKIVEEKLKLKQEAPEDEGGEDPLGDVDLGSLGDEGEGGEDPIGDDLGGDLGDEEPKDEYKGDDEALTFTDKEVEAAKEVLPKDTDFEVENKITVGFTIGDADYKLVIKKKKVKNENKHVYYVDATKNDDEVDRERASKESKKFDSEDDIDALKNFISDLAIGRQITEAEEMDLGVDDVGSKNALGINYTGVSNEREADDLANQILPITKKYFVKMWKEFPVEAGVAAVKNAATQTFKALALGAFGMPGHGTPQAEKIKGAVEKAKKKAEGAVIGEIFKTINVKDEKGVNPVQKKLYIAKGSLDAITELIGKAKPALGNNIKVIDDDMIKKSILAEITGSTQVKRDAYAAFDRLIKSGKNKEQKSEENVDGEVVAQEDAKNELDGNQSEDPQVQTNDVIGVETHEGPEVADQVRPDTVDQNAIKRSKWMVNGPLGETVRYWVLSNVRGDMSTAKTLRKAIDTIIRKSKLDTDTVYGAFGDPFDPNNSDRNWENCKPIWVEKVGSP